MSSAPARELFIYYRLAEANTAAAAALVRTFQARLRAAEPALAARLLRRPPAADGMATWMETYALDATQRPAGIDAALQAQIEAEAAPLRPLLDGTRHTEVFLDATFA